MGALQDIIDMYGKGGIEVITFADIENADAGQRPLIRTVIQPNASLITWVYPGSESELALERHNDKLQSQLQSIKNLRRRLKTAGEITVAAAVFSLNAFTWEWDISLITRLLSSAAAIFLFRFLFRYLILFTFRWYIRRKIQGYFSSLAG